MALCHFPSLFILHNFKNVHPKLQTHHYPLQKTLSFTLSAEKSSKKEKGLKASKSNEDLCKELREFVLAVGLSKDHVPSMKELSDYGRKDLANIVRRRGYKVITELIKDSLKNDSDGKKPSVGDQNSTNACNDEASDVKERILAESNESVSSPSGSSMEETHLVRTNSAIATDTSVQIPESSDSSVSSLHLRAMKFVQTGKLEIFEGGNLVTWWSKKQKVVARSFAEAAYRVMPRIVSELVWLKSLLSDLNVAFLPSDANEVLSGEMPTDTGHAFSNISSDILGDPAYVDSQEAPLLEQEADRDQVISNQGLEVSDSDENLPSEMVGERVNQVEIDRLKAMLHKKEMELLELKRQTEKEKQSLHILQEKANGEIGNAHRMETEKHMKLRAAEESLGGLKEVQIVYWGNGESVEVAGSFNGWHNRIKMDMNPSCKPVDSPCLRNLKLWSTILWLYPGTYEIKFIVDGIWTVDSNRQITTRCCFTNNVLRVDR